MRRIRSRQANGRFRRGTLANTFGFHAPVCPKCRTFNPHRVGELAPNRCHACSAFLGPAMPWWYTLTAIMLIEGMRRQMGDLETARKQVIKLVIAHPVPEQINICLSLGR